MYTMEQKTNYDPLYLITAAQNLSVGAAVATETLCLKQVVNVIRSTISYFNENCVFTTFFSMSKANRSADYTLSFCWMVTIQPTRQNSSTSAARDTTGGHLCTSVSLETKPAFVKYRVARCFSMWCMMRGFPCCTGQV